MCLNQQEERPLINDLHKGKNATAETQSEGYEATKAIDGKKDTHWAASPYYKWWKIDLEDVYHIDEINILTNIVDEGYTHYFLEISQDNLNWETVIEKEDDLFSETGEHYTLDCVARYIRVTVTYSALTRTAKMRNFEVKGKALTDQEKQELTRSDMTKFLASQYAKATGFEVIDVDVLEPEKTYRVVMGEKNGSFLYYPNVDFKDGVDQLRGQFGFTDANKQYKITLEVRVDQLDGEKIGELVLFKQWKMWSVLGGHLEHPDPRYLTGAHDIYLIIKSADEPQRLMIHWLDFVKTSALPAPRPLPAELPPPKTEYRIYFGNLHSHTDFSDGKSVPEHAFDYARYEAGLDFFALTEHSNLYDNNLDWDKSRKFKAIQKMAKEKTEPNAFLALYGSETTWYNEFGHMNTYNMDFFLNAYETKYNDIPVYYDTVKAYPDSINQWNHPWSSGNRHLDGFDPYDAELDQVLQLLEVNPDVTPELDGLYYYVKALDKGWHVSPVGNQDNHKENWGTQNNLRTGLLVDQLTEHHFYDAVRKNRVYFTTALHLKVWFRINGAIMGSRIKSTDQLNFKIKACYGVDTEHHIEKFEVISRQGSVLHTVHVEDEKIDSEFTLPGSEPYYFIKVYQDDGEFAATSPIWIEA